MNRVRTVSTVFFLAALLTLFAQPLVSTAFALDTTCEFNPLTQSFDYSISGGDAGATYDANFTVTGCVTLDGTPPSMTGPEDSGSIGLLCGEASSTAYVEIEICKGTVCYELYEFNLNCQSDCNIVEIQHVPSNSLFGIIALVVIMSVTAALVIRRRRAIA